MPRRWTDSELDSMVSFDSMSEEQWERVRERQTEEFDERNNCASDEQSADVNTAASDQGSNGGHIITPAEEEAILRRSWEEAWRIRSREYDAQVQQEAWRAFVAQHCVNNEQSNVPVPVVDDSATGSAVEVLQEPRRDRWQWMKGFLKRVRTPLVFAVVAAAIWGGVKITCAAADSLAEAKREAARLAEPVVTVTCGDVGIRMVKVDGGAFNMGCDDNYKWASDIEKPMHSVRLDTYYIAETEVTQRLWESVMGSNPSIHKGDMLPVECVSKDDCGDFIKRLNKMTGRTFRLPTEAEWEFAAMGGVKSLGYKYSGSNTVYEVGWVFPKAGNRTHKVGSKRPNELGLYDMSGNVWEWCSDIYDEYDDADAENPAGAWFGSKDVVRGGGYDREAVCAASKCRNALPYGSKGACVGLRLVMELLR